MTAPTIVSTGVITGSTSWGTDKPKTASIAMNANDFLVVIGIGGDYGGAGDDFSTPTGGSITYTLRQQTQLTLNSFPWGWTGQSGSTQTVTLSLTVPTNSPRYGAVWAVVRGSGGYDNSAKANGTGGASISVTTTTDNCAIIMGVGDWDATDGTVRTYRTINLITPIGGGAGEIAYDRTVGEYTAYGAVWSDAGAAGSKTAGFSAPTAGVKYAGVVVAMKGASATTVQAVLAGALGGLTASATAVPRVSAVLAGPLGGATASTAATVTHHAVLAGSLGGLTGALAATPRVFAVLSGSLGALVGTITATVRHAATLVATSALTGHIDATITGQVDAVMAAPLGGLTGAMVATVGAPTIEAVASASIGFTSRAVATIVPPVVTPPSQGGNAGWYQYLSILAEMRDEHVIERERVPAACPNDGEPLTAGPEGTGILYCPYDGWQYPRDYVRPR